MALNYTIVNGVLGLSFVSAFIMAFSSFFFASLREIASDFNMGDFGARIAWSKVVGINNGEGFFVVISSLSFCVFIAGTAFFVNKRLGKIVYGFVLASTIHIILLSLMVAVWTGLKLSALDSLFSSDTAAITSDVNYTSSGRAVIAGASLVLIFQTVFLVLLHIWRAQFVAETDNAYGGPTSYQPNAAYGNYDTTGAAPGGEQSYQADPQHI